MIKMRWKPTLVRNILFTYNAEPYNINKAHKKFNVNNCIVLQMICSYRIVSALTVAQWNADTKNQSAEPIQTDSACLNETQPHNIPVSQPCSNAVSQPTALSYPALQCRCSVSPYRTTTM